MVDKAGRAFLPILVACLGALAAACASASSRPAVVVVEDTSPLVEADRLLLLAGNGTEIPVDAPDWTQARYFHETNRGRPYTGRIESSYTNGAKRLRASVRDGRLEGQGFVWHENGKPMLELSYSSGNVVGRKEWKDDGMLVSTFPDTAPPTLPPPTGTTNEIPAGAVDFATIEKRGNLLYEITEMIVPFTGITVEKHPKGRVARIQRFKEGMREGLTQEWHSNGQLRFQAVYHEDNPDGVVSCWYPNGRKEYENTWTGGFPELRVTFAPDGTESGRVDKDGNGRLVRFYYPSGKRKAEEEYKDNPLAPVKETWWYEDGTLQDPPAPPLTPPTLPPSSREPLREPRLAGRASGR